MWVKKVQTMIHLEIDVTKPNIMQLLQDTTIYLGQRGTNWRIPAFLDGQPVVGSAFFQTSGGRIGLILNLGNYVVINYIVSAILSYYY